MKSVRSVPPFAATQRNYLWMCWPLLERIEVLNVEANSRLGKLVTRNSYTQSLKLTSGSYKRRLSSITSFARFYQQNTRSVIMWGPFRWNTKTMQCFFWKYYSLWLWTFLGFEITAFCGYLEIGSRIDFWSFAIEKFEYNKFNELTKQYREAENQIKLFFHLRLMAVRR